MRLLLLGASERSGADHEAVTYPSDYSKYKGGYHMITCVCAHLEFTAQFGTAALNATRDGRMYFAHRTEYERWIADGAPGLSLAQVQDEIASFRL